jgi:hypothetical protein
MLAELSRLLGPQHAATALDKFSAATSLGISEQYLLDLVRSRKGSGLTWDKYQAWLDGLREDWITQELGPP